jgi:hypothetical protein
VIRSSWEHLQRKIGESFLEWRGQNAAPHHPSLKGTDLAKPWTQDLEDRGSNSALIPLLSINTTESLKTAIENRGSFQAGKH